MATFSVSRQKNLLRVVAHAIAWSAAAYLAYRWWSDGLGVNPVETVTRITGRATLMLLVLTIACTPAKWIGLRQATTVRRTLGLYAFIYSVVHFMALVGLDYGFDWTFIQDDALATKPFIAVGLASLLIMLPLAITSNAASMRKLGRNWKRLHRLVYVAVILGVVHYIWVVKAVTAGPTIVAVVVALLLVARAPRFRRLLTQRRLAKT